MVEGVPLSYDDETSAPDPVMVENVWLTYGEEKVTQWTAPWVSRPNYAPAPSEPNGGRYLYTSMIIESISHKELHYMRAILEVPRNCWLWVHLLP